MDAQKIKTSKDIKLKPNGVFVDVNIPYFYQRRAGLLMLLRPRMVLGDDVGLGKTLETILAVSYFKAQKQETKFLIFTEKTALRQWVKEFKWLTPQIKTKIITAETNPDPQQRVRAMRQHGADVVLTSYSMLHNYWKYLKEGMGERWIVIFDEPDFFKNTETVTHRNAFEMVNGPGGPARIYALTATIVGNRLDEAFGILRIVAPGTLSSRKEFEKNFCKMKRIKKMMKVVGYKNLDQFRKQIEPVFYGRLQDDPEVEQDLPEVITKDVEVELGKEQSWKVVETMDRIVSMPDGEVKQLGILPAMTMSQILTDDPRVKGFDIVGAKIEALKETINGSLRGQRIVVFSKFRSVVDLLEEEVRKVTNYPILRITGKESWEEKEAAKNFFMSEEEGAESSILFLTNAGRRAINLQKGGHLFFFDLPWAYDDYRQIIGRLKRTGSTHKRVGVYRMMGVLHPDVAAQVGTEETIDHYTLGVLMEKFKLWQALTGDAKEIETSDSDVMDIYQAIKNSYRVAA